MNLLGKIDPWDPKLSVQEARTSNEKPFPFRPEFRERISRSSSPPNRQRGGWRGVMDLFPHPGCPPSPIASISAPSSPRTCRPHTKFVWRCSFAAPTKIGLGTALHRPLWGLHSREVDRMGGGGSVGFVTRPGPPDRAPTPHRCRLRSRRRESAVLQTNFVWGLTDEEKGTPDTPSF